MMKTNWAGILESVKKELATLDDTFVNQYLTDLGNYLGQFQDNKPFGLTFYVTRKTSSMPLPAPQVISSFIPGSLT
jgi:hypothetical protein